MYVKGVKYFTEQQIKGSVKVFESAFYSFYATSIQRNVIHLTHVGGVKSELCIQGLLPLQEERLT